MEQLFPKRKYPRLATYDYRTPGAYFITICTHNRRCLLSSITDLSTEPQLTPYGRIAKEQLFLLEKRYPSLKIDQCVIMPNHIHAILILEKAADQSQAPAIPNIIGAYKSLTTKACNRLRPTGKLFQTSFYDHVIRGQADYDEIAQYILNNPTQWALDKLYTEES